MNKTILPFYAKLAYVLVGIISMGYLAIVGKEVLAPLSFGFLFSILLLPIANFLQNKWHFSRGVSTLISILILLLGVFCLFFFLGSQLSGLADDWPNLQHNLQNNFSELQNWVKSNFHLNAQKQLDYLRKGATDALSSGASFIGGMILSVSSVLMYSVFALIFTSFILGYRSQLNRFFIAVFPSDVSHLVKDVIFQVQHVIGSYVIGLLLEMAIVISLGITAYLIIGIKYAILLGFIAGVLNLVPYIGIFTTLVLGAIMTYATGEPHQVIYVVIVTLGIHLVDANIIMPKVVGSKVKINALIVILGVLIGGMMWGISGMFLSVPFIAILKVIFEHVNELKPWALLLGEDDTVKRRSKKVVKPREEG